MAYWRLKKEGVKNEDKEEIEDQEGEWHMKKKMKSNEWGDEENVKKKTMNGI